MKELFQITDNSNEAGSIFFSWQKGQNAKYLVTTGYDQIVNLYDRYGNKINSFNLNGICTGLEWNKNGDLLALISDHSSTIKLWDSNNQKIINLDYSIKESLNLLLWSIKNQNLLAITTVKGNLLIYDHNTSRKIPILGKHSKKIISGCWTNQNLLALVCEDKYLSISDESGDTVFQTNLKSKCNLVKSSLKPIEFANLKQTTDSSLAQQQPIFIESHCVSVVLNRKQIILLPIQSLDTPLILSFEDRYGEIFDYYWQSNGTLLIAFNSGFIINIQTLSNQLGKELFNVKIFSDTITNLNLCEQTNCAAVISKNVIKLLNTNTLEQIDNVHIIEDEQELEWLELSTNGQYLAVSSASGNLHVFLMKLPNVNCTYQTRIAYLSSLLEITIIDIEQDKLNERDKFNKVQLDIEPTVIAINNTNFVACMNNRAYFYDLNNLFNNDNNLLNSNDLDIIKEKEYSSIIKNIYMNDQYAAILFTDNKSILQRLPHLDDQFDYLKNNDTEFNKKEIKKDYYQVDTKLKIICIHLTNNFFIWSNSNGIIELFSIEEWAIVSIHRHLHSIKNICPDLLGLSILLVDERNEAFIYDATNEQLTPVEIRRIEEGDELDDLTSLNYDNLPTERIVVGQRNYTELFPFQFNKLLWDLSDHSMFAVIDKKQILVYYFVSKSIQGPFIQLIGKSKLEEGILPLMINDGFVYYQNVNGNISCIQLETHNYSKLLGNRNKNSKNVNIKSNQQEIFCNLLKLRRIDDCWIMCRSLNNVNYWLQFIDCCLHDLNISESIRIARYIGHAGLVWSLKSIQHIEEWNLLAGHLAMYLQWFDLAEKLYLKSTQPIYALRLRLDLMQWDICLILAKRLANDQLPFIHKQQANELEFEENYGQALEHYQDALLDKLDLKNDQLDKVQISKHNQEVLGGISRCLIKCNDSKKGMQIAMKLEDLDLVRKTAIICEEQNLLNDAAQLYERTGDYENACSLYLKTRNLTKVKELLNNQQLIVNHNWPTKSILLKYGDLQEKEGKYIEAFKAYEQANQLLDCVRLLLDKLNKPQEAVKLVRENRTTEACLLIAKHFQQTGDYESAIEFLVYSGKMDEAFELALQESQMNLYTNALLQIIYSKSSNNNNLTWFELELDLQNDQNLIRQLQRIAVYYEEEHNLLNAGKFYCLAGQLRKGISNLLKAHSIQKTSLKQQQSQTQINTNDDPLKLAIEFVCKIGNDEQSIQQVIEVLLNELDGNQTKDFQYLFKLYMCSGQFREATKTALLLAKDEQINGNYDQAHNLLVEMCKNLFSNKLKISFELLSALHLLHCYKLAKIYLKFEKLEESCELLCKVSNSINKFPKHAAQILSTTVLECLKLGNKRQAINYSTILLQNNNYLEQLDVKFKRKIETLIRKSASIRRDSSADPQIAEESSCPFCYAQLINKFQLSCNSCRNIIPFSILTGYHLTNEDCYYCNNCYLPFIYKEFSIFIENDNDSCPACGSKLTKETISKLESFTLVT